MPKNNPMREKIEQRLDTMRKRFPEGYAQLSVALFHMPPSYAMEDNDSAWWKSQEAKDFAESLRPCNWHQ